MTRMIRFATIGLFLACIAMAARASVLEIEPNNSFLTAQAVVAVAPAPSYTELVLGNRIDAVASSADYFSFDVAGPSFITLRIESVSNGGSPVLALYAPTLVNNTPFVLSASDSALPEIFRFEVLTRGLYRAAVGDIDDPGNPLDPVFGDGVLVGGGATGYGYSLRIGVAAVPRTVPEPAALLLLIPGLALLGVARRRGH